MTTMYHLCYAPPPTDYYFYRLETPWKRTVTAPNAAATFLGTRRGSVACSWCDLCSCWYFT